MKGDCPKCGFPLNKGNIKVVRPRGKKRPFRIHRRCPEVKPVPPLDNIGPYVTDTADASGLQRPQDTTGGPVTVDLVWEYQEPPRLRYFMTQEQAERVKRALTKQTAAFGVGVEVIPVPDYQVEQNPEAFADLVEVKFEWKN